MFTPRLNNEIRNVIGLMTPCHRPSQNPATCGASTCATLFGPAAQATRASAVTTSTATAVVLHFLIRITPRYPAKAYRGEGQTQRSPVDGTICRRRQGPHRPGPAPVRL